MLSNYIAAMGSCGVGASGRGAAAVTHAISTASGAAGTSYVSGSFTPASGDLLVAFVHGLATVAVATMTDSQGLGFTLITSATRAAGATTLYLFIANALAAASAMTVTFDCTGDSANGTIISVARVSNMGKTGATAALHTATESNVTGTPAPVFSGSVLTNNPTLGAVMNQLNPSGITEPASWTEQSDTSQASPVSSLEYVSRDSGFTGTTITWGSTAGAHGTVAVELDWS